jgi:CPA2 family monovalent cation:H+ antiporter-2
VLDQRDFNQFMARHPAMRAAVSEIAEQRREMNLLSPRDDAASDDGGKAAS